jgi:hypothetical protein
MYSSLCCPCMEVSLLQQSVLSLLSLDLSVCLFYSTAFCTIPRCWACSNLCFTWTYLFNSSLCCVRKSWSTVQQLVLQMECSSTIAFVLHRTCLSTTACIAHERVCLQELCAAPGRVCLQEQVLHLCVPFYKTPSNAVLVLYKKILFVSTQVCLFRVFRYRFETPKQTEKIIF